VELEVEEQLCATGTDLGDGGGSVRDEEFEPQL
jgi:hypothetical protein